MPLNESPLPAESFKDTVLVAINIHHPDLRIELAWLKKYLSKLVRNEGPEQKFWISIYNQFFEFSSVIDRHMFREETTLFPYLEAKERDVKVQTALNLEESPHNVIRDHKVISQQWSALTEAIKGYPGPFKNKLLVEDFRSNIAEFEVALKVHDEYETREIYEKAAKTGFLRPS